MDVLKYRECRVCRRVSEGKTCSDECDGIHERMTATNRFPGAKAKPAAMPVAEELETHWGAAFGMENPEPCVMYGLLTAADVRELERRKAKFGEKSAAM